MTSSVEQFINERRAGNFRILGLLMAIITALAVLGVMASLHS